MGSLVKITSDLDRQNPTSKQLFSYCVIQMMDKKIAYYNGPTSETFRLQRFTSANIAAHYTYLRQKDWSSRRFSAIINHMSLGVTYFDHRHAGILLPTFVNNENGLGNQML